mmetsp:Transcript_36918/g.57755  ORF Transcript_36918/g.57755 Transcript_36918/m.57755 type:complete len:128 (+) Transcript_36918:644-1027(+)
MPLRLLATSKPSRSAGGHRLYQLLQFLQLHQLHQLNQMKQAISGVEDQRSRLAVTSEARLAQHVILGSTRDPGSATPTSHSPLSATEDETLNHPSPSMLRCTKGRCVPITTEGLGDETQRLTSVQAA